LTQIDANQIHYADRLDVGRDGETVFDGFAGTCDDRLAAGEISYEVAAALKVAVSSVIKWAQNGAVVSS